MNESIEFFESPPSFTDLVDRAMMKYGCRVYEMSLRGRFDCGKARAHYVLMNLASDSNWKHYKDVVHESNVACLEVIVEIVRMPGPNVVFREEVVVVNRNGTQESEILHHVLGEIECAFDLAIANGDFSNNTFERDETNIDDDNVSMGSEDSEFNEDGVVERDVELPSVPNDEDISMVHKAICESSMVNSEGMPFSESLVIKKGMKFNSLEELKFFLADYAVRLHRPFSIVHSDKNLRISNVVQPHTCRSSQPRRVDVQCTTKYLGRRILGIIRKDSETSLVESIFAFSGYRVKYSKALRAKQHAVALLWGGWKESYGIVPRVLTAIAYYNPRVKRFIDSCGMMHPDNGQLVPLAFALAESENNESWSWFMKLVWQHVLGPSRQVCMISDRHHRLLNCAKDHMDGFPPLVHRWCTRHFAANMSRRQKTDRVIGKLKTLCKVHTEREFSEKLEDLVKDLNDDAKEWLTGHRIRKVADEFLSQAELRSVHYLAEPYGPERMVYSIKSCGTTNVGGESHGGRHYRVDLNEVSCTYNIPQLLHLPCSHFITACKARGLNYESPLYMSPLYSREHTIRIWESSFQRYLDPPQWPAYEGVGYVPNSNLMRNKVGRRQKKRLIGDMDVSQGRLSADYGIGDFDVDKMVAPVYPLLESMYDLQHRAHHLANLQEDLKPLRARVHSPLRWDERYAQYLQRAGFLDIAVHVVAGVPPMDGPLLTAMVDRWRLETHTFHLPFGEMTITMQDIAMILGLPPEGHPVTGIIQNEKMRDMVAMHIGIRPLEPEDGDNSKKTSGPWYRNDAHPTFYHVWKHVQPIRGNPDRHYRAYINELDVVMQHEVICSPDQIVFSPTCYRDRELWRCMTPIILYYVVEFHMPHRVMRQFGMMQPCPPLELSTLQQLHKINRRKRYKENDWRVKHAQYLIQWENRQRCDPEGGPYWRAGPNNEYI
uniref:Aminotransferase-like plant mobile domain-containing protein n=1 Tax=Setaria italica TaxID=4555 RepID=K4ALS8_SETIT